MMKAFVVTADYVDASVLVFAGYPSRAKLLAHGTEWLCDADWCDLRCRREPRANCYAGDDERILFADKEPDQRILRNLGWYEVEGNTDPCRECELYEWDKVPESRLVYDSDDLNPICFECQSGKESE